MIRTLPLLALLLSVALPACHRPPPAGPAAAEAKPPPPAPLVVETAAVEVRRVPRLLTLTGSVLADRQSDVAANTAGQVSATYVERGQPVKKGQPLARIDARSAGLQAAAASAQSRAAESQVEQAQQECARADTLLAEGGISPADHERQKARCTAALYAANAARAQADLAGKVVDDTTIRAPFDGVIGERFVNVGEYVMPASRVASVFAIDPVRVAINVPEPLVGQVREGQSLKLRVSAHPGRTFPAEVRFLGAALRPGTRDLVVEAAAPNADRALRPGMFASVELVVGDEESATVPREALRSEGTVHRIFLAEGSVARERVVKRGVEVDGRVAIDGGVAAGALVILRPPTSLRDGGAIQ